MTWPLGLFTTAPPKEREESVRRRWIDSSLSGLQTLCPVTPCPKSREMAVRARTTPRRRPGKPRH